MRNKSALLLMELLAMVLVFALAAAMCLQLFSRCAAIAESTRQLDAAVVLAQNAAALLKGSRGDAAALETLEADGFTLELIPSQASVPGLEAVQIRILAAGELVYSLETGWQEVGR